LTARETWKISNGPLEPNTFESALLVEAEPDKFTPAVLACFEVTLVEARHLTKEGREDWAKSMPEVARRAHESSG
jgi:hypothetical protein